MNLVHQRNIEVEVRANDLEKALRLFKKKVQTDGVFRRAKMKMTYEKPSQSKRRKAREAARKHRSLAAAKSAGR